MYAVTSMPLVSRTRATFRSAEFGFFGVTVRTWVQTPRFWGEPMSRRVLLVSALYITPSAGALLFFRAALRPLRTNWLIVGTSTPHSDTVKGRKAPFDRIRHWRPREEPIVC